MQPQTIDQFIQLLNPIQQTYAITLRRLIHEAVPTVQEMIFASVPAYYIPIEGETSFHKMPMIMMNFFPDHLNLFAAGNSLYQTELFIYKMTKKHTLQIDYHTPLLEEVLRSVFLVSLRRV